MPAGSSSTCCFAVAIVVALSRRETPLLVVLDVATIAVGVGVVVGIVLVGPDLVASLVPMKVRVTQACYVVCDVILFSAAARLALRPGPARSPAGCWRAPRWASCSPTWHGTG